MTPADRWLLAVTLVVVDLVVVVVPLTGLCAAYVILVRPRWFQEWVEKLYAST